jgi:DNA repair exonuclease SbcCD nuclease subunit
MKILFTADWHIKISKDIPEYWERQRLRLLIQEINNIYREHCCNLVVIGGDILDIAKPSTEELDLYFEAMASLNVDKCIIYTGNHEVINFKSCLIGLKEETTRCNPKVEIITEPYRSEDFDIIDFVELHKKEWIPSKSKICFTHVRGSIPPHVKPEIDLEKFNKHGYSLVIAGDLHSVTNSQFVNKTPLLYPGSPFSTTFIRTKPNNNYGVYIVDTDTLSYDWISLDHLPQLILQSISSEEEIKEDSYNRVMYELVGNVVELGKVSNNSLIKKKVNTGITKNPKLDLRKASKLEDEFLLYCRNILKINEKQIEDLLTELHNSVDISKYND